MRVHRPPRRRFADRLAQPMRLPMSKRLVLFGASNFGDEVVQLFRDINESSDIAEWEITGFLDDDPALSGSTRNGVPVLGTRSWLDHNDLSGIYFVCSIGNPRAKARIVESLRAKGLRFATGVHPSVIRSETVAFGQGTIVTAGNILTTNISIGAHVIINLACTVGHKSTIGDYATINPGVNVSGDVKVEEGVLLGTGACIVEKLTIGAYSIIGAGSVVTRDIPARVTAFGSPARVMKEHGD